MSLQDRLTIEKAMELNWSRCEAIEAAIDEGLIPTEKREQAKRDLADALEYAAFLREKLDAIGGRVPHPEND